MSDNHPPAADSAAAPKPLSKHADKLLTKAESLGVPGNVVLAQYVLILEERLETLEAKLGIKNKAKEAGQS